MVGWHYWLSRSYFFVSPQTINSVLTQMTGNPQTEPYKTGWRVTAGTVARQVMKRDSEAFLSWITAHSFSFSALTLTGLSLPPSPPLLWNPTAVLIPRILLQGLISFPFLERLFKYCYIYRHSSSASLTLSLPSSHCTDWGKFPFFHLHLFSFVSFCPLCSSLLFCGISSLYSDTIVCTNICNSLLSRLMIHMKVITELRAPFIHCC